MNIPQLHTNLFWDLSCLTLFLTGLYFSCIIFFRSPFWKSLATPDFFPESINPWKFRIPPMKMDMEVNGPEDPISADRSNKEDIKIKNVYSEIYQGKALNDLEVEYEVLIDPAIEKQIREILESYAEEQEKRENIFLKDGEGDNNGNRGEDSLDLSNIALPAAKFYSKKENERVKLLYAIAELGDVREVSFLQGMLDEEQNTSISILIKEIIFGFLAERPLNKHRDLEVPKMGYISEHYVYKYLFQAIDTESQYLLLDEVLKIGGLEELDFLRTLSRHPEKGIRDKAGSIIDQLEQKLQPQKDRITTEFELAEKENEILGIDFELDINEIKTQETGPDNGKKEWLESSRLLPIKQLIHTLSSKLGGLSDRLKL